MRLLLSGLVAATLLALAALPGTASASGCTITWVGDVNDDWFGGTSPTDTNWDDNTFPDGSDHVCVNSGTVQLNTPTQVSHYSIAGPATLNIGDSDVLTALADSTNAGTINLTANSSELRTENGNGAAAETLTNTGTIAAGGVGTQYIGGDVVNQGTLSVTGADVRFRNGVETIRSATLANSGQLTVTSGSLLKVINSSTLVQAGTISGGGRVEVDSFGARLRVSGGTIAAGTAVEVVGSGSNGAPGSGVDFVGAEGATGKIGIAMFEHPVSGDVPAGIVLDVRASANLSASASWTNAGTINLLGNNSEMRTENGATADTETLTNTGTITTAESGNPFQYIGGDLINQGTLSIRGAEVRFRNGVETFRQATLTNSGQLTVIPTAVLRVINSSILVQATGGTIGGSGKVEVDSFGARLRVSGGTIAAGTAVDVVGSGFNGAPGAGLDFVNAAGATGKIGIATAEHPVSGDVPAGIALEVRTGALVSAPAGWTNAGTITLLGSAELRTSAGSVTNTGTISSSGGTPSVSGGLINAGTLAPGGANVGTINASAFTQTATGRLEIDVVGPNASDRLAVQGAATLNGRLALTRTGGVAVGQTFDVLTHGSRTGTFGSVSGAGSGPFSVRYEPGAVRLEVVDPSSLPSVSAGDASVVEGESGTTTLSMPITLGAATAAPVSVRAVTVDRSATSPSDFASADTVVTIPAGQTSATLAVTVNGDETVEPDEQLLVRLDDPVNAQLGDDQGTGTILTDDPGLTSLTPNRGGDAGTTTVTVHGIGLAAGSTLRLARAGQADVAATEVVAAPDGKSVTGVLDLAGRPLGAWDVVVTLPAGRGSATLPSAFTVETARPADVWVKFAGRDSARPGRPFEGWLAYGNTGNVDATGVWVEIAGLPRFTKVRLPNIEPAAVFSENERGRKLNFFIPRLAPGATAYLPFEPVFAAGPVALRARITDDQFSPADVPVLDESLSASLTFTEQTATRRRGSLTVSPVGAVAFDLQTAPAAALVQPVLERTTTAGVEHRRVTGAFEESSGVFRSYDFTLDGPTTVFDALRRVGGHGPGFDAAARGDAPRFGSKGSPGLGVGSLGRLREPPPGRRLPDQERQATRR